jgi:hypothetical protein
MAAAAITLVACKAVPEKPRPAAVQDKSTGTLLAVAESEIGDIALDATNVYWVESWTKEGTIYRVPKAGGAPTKIATVPPWCAHLTVDESRVYCTTDKNILVVAKDGGVPAPLGAPFDCDLGCALAVDATHVWYSVGTGIMRMNKDGSQASVFAADIVQACAIALTPTHVYWSTPIRANSNATVKRAAMATGKTETLVADAHMLSDSHPIFADATTVRFVVGSVVNAVPVAGGPTKEEATMTGLAKGVAYDRGDLFWASETKHIGAPHKEDTTPLVGDPTRRQTTMTGGYRAEGHGGLTKRAAGAKEDRPVVPETDDVSAIALDDTSVYWVETASKKIRKHAR